MAVLKMKRINICALRKNRKPILEIIQRKGVVEVKNIKNQDFEKVDTSKTRFLFEKNLNEAKKSLKVLNKYFEEQFDKSSSLKGKKDISIDDYYNLVKSVDSVVNKISRINLLEREILENNAHKIKFQTQIETLTPWEKLDISMRFKGTKLTTSFIGILPEQFTLENILIEFNKLKPAISKLHVEIISTSQEQTCIFVLCDKIDEMRVENTLKKLGFSKPSLPSKTIPSERITFLENQIIDLEEKNNTKINEIKSYLNEVDHIKFIIDYYAMRIDKYKIIDDLVHTKKTFLVTGYIAEKNSGELKSYLEKNFDAAIEIEDLKDDEDVPVILKNNPVSAPVESVLESYSLPKKGEIDPTSIMSFFYYILFGMMLSDAAYGFIVTLCCGIALLKFKNMESGIKRSLKLFFYCGISTMFWGVMFGSYFGDAITVIAKTFFNTDVIIQPIWFAPIDNTMFMLAFSFGVGVLHLFTGLGIQFYQLCKERKFKDAIFDVVFWYLLVGGAVVYLLSMEMFVSMMSLTFILPKLAGDISLWCMIVGAIGILFTSGRSSKGFFKRFLKGLYGLYGVTGYLSDILSYSRLLALGLATGVIATVFNKMGSMFGSGVIGWICFILVFLIGHTLNIGINLLGAYVHTNRLEFVEFFGKFYEGGGKKFSPFSIKTKYYKIREEMNHG